MRKKVLLAIIIVLMIVIFFVGGAPISVASKNYVQFASFVGIAVAVYILMKKPKED